MPAPLSVTDRLYALIGMCACTTPLCNRCSTLAEAIGEINALRERLGIEAI